MTPGEKSGPRITIVEQSYYQQSLDEDPQWATRKHVRFLNTTEQPYVRKLQVHSGKPTPLDTGWIKDCSQLILCNEEGRSYRQVPSEDELGDLAKRVIEVGILQGEFLPVLVIRPGESCRFEPYCLGGWGWWLRCQHQSAKVMITVYPK